MELKQAKCPNPDCREENEFKIAELPTKHGTGSYGLGVSAVYCDKCKTVVGIVDDSLRGTLGNLVALLKAKG